MTGGELAVELLPARQGDCILVSWGPQSDRHRLLVDAGPAIAYDAVRERLTEVAAEGPLDLLVLSHIDRDHIEGTLLLVNDAELDIGIGQVWYNGAPQLATGQLAPVHGEILGAIIKLRGLRWNRSFDAGPICADGDESCPARTLDGGLTLTVLGPSGDALRRLRDEWDTAWQDAGFQTDSVTDAMTALDERRALRPGSSYLASDGPPNMAALLRTRPGKDRKTPNASSIVLLAEYGGSRLLLAGDATPAELLAGVQRYLAARELTSLPLSAFKLPHHGSGNNINRQLIELLPAEKYLFSSDGSYYNHPDDIAVATVACYGPDGAELVFNYDNPRVRRWEDVRLGAAYGYTVRYPEAGADGVRVGLGAVAREPA